MDLFFVVWRILCRCKIMFNSHNPFWFISTNSLLLFIFFFLKKWITFLSASFLSIFTNHSYILGYESCGSHNTTISLAIKKSFFFVVFNHNVYKYIWNKSQRVENNVNKLWSLSFPFRSFVVLPFAKRRCVPNAIVSFYFIYAKMLICVIQYFPFITLFYYMCVFSKQDVFILLRKMA